MTYATHNDGYVDVHDINGTSLQGYINATYDQLVSLFGEPMDGCGYKTDCEWIVTDMDEGTIGTIYNWKNGRNYLGAQGLYPEQITRWHVGGIGRDAVRMFDEILQQEDMVHEDAWVMHDGIV